LIALKAALSAPLLLIRPNCSAEKPVMTPSLASDRGRGRSLAHREGVLETLQREIDRLFDGFATGLPSLGQMAAPTMDISETDKEMEITAELPGLEQGDVQITVADGVLTIRGEKKSEREEKDKSYRLVERSYGAFSRSVELPAGADPAAVKAVMAKGVLTVTIPKPAAKNATRIEVRSAA
jgi:HSP20 family protein